MRFNLPKAQVGRFPPCSPGSAYPHAASGVGEMHTFRPAVPSLLRRPTAQEGEFIRITPPDASWEHLHFAVRRLAPGERWAHATGPHEYGLVILGGVCSVDSPRNKWETLGRRPDVFHGMPYALYLPRDTEFTLTAGGAGCQVAYGWGPPRGA